MAERVKGGVARGTIDTFVPVAPDAVRMCSGPCGEAKPCSSFATVSARPGARYGECRACRDARLGTAGATRTGDRLDAAPVDLPVTDFEFDFTEPPERGSFAKVGETRRFPDGGHKASIRAQRSAVAEVVRAVLVERRGHAMSIDQVYEAVLDRVTFAPTEADVRDRVRDLVKSDERCVKLGRDAFAWVLPGEALPAPPVPAHVVQMIERRWRGLTLNEIGAEFGVTRERVRQLLKKHSGPSAEEIRELRAAEARSAQRAHDEAVTGAIREALDGRGPMTVAEIANATGLDAGHVSKRWPQDLAHLRLWGAGMGESRWTADQICEALRQASAYEFPLTRTAYSDLLQIGQVEGPSVPRISQRFGSWTAACAAAGVVAGDPWNREYESKWSDDDLLQIARAYLLDPDVPSSAHRFDEWKRENAPDGPSAQTLRNRFGSWSEVKRCALAQGGQTS